MLAVPSGGQSPWPGKCIRASKETPCQTSCMYVRLCIHAYVRERMMVVIVVRYKG